MSSAQVQQLQQAIINAHNAGDVEAAKRLGQLYNNAANQPTVSASTAPVAPHRQPQAQQPQQQPQAKDGAFEGFGDAFVRGIDQPLENMGVTAEALGQKELAKSLKGAVDERPGQSASAQFMNADEDGSFAWRYLPKAGVEQAGQFAGSILSRLAGMGLGGLAGSVIPGAGTAGGALVGGLTGPMLFEAAQQLGPIALERAKNNGREVPNQEDWKYATGTSVGVGALNAIAPGLSGPLKRILVEGATEGTQSVVEQVGSTVNTKKGLEVDPRQAVAEGIIGGTSAGMVDASINTVSAATNLVSGNKVTNEQDMEAAASLAQRIAGIAEANGYDLKDIDKMSTKGARETVDKAHVQYTEELKQLFKDLKSRVKVTDQDSLQEVVDKILAEAAYREGRNKTKNTVGRQEMDALARLAGDTFEGQQAMSVLRQLNQLTEIHNGGYQGGVSKLTDQLSPLGTQVGYDKGAVATERLLRPIVSGSAAVSTGGTSLLGQLAAQGTGRAIDKVTGRRSTVDRFVRQNQNRPGIAQSTAPSLRMQNIEAQKAQEAEAEAARVAQEQIAQEEREANLARVQQGAPPLLGSPEDIFRDGTGLDRSGIARVLRILKSNPNTKPAVRRAIQAYETSVATGGRVDFSLIRDINAFVDNNPTLGIVAGPRNTQAAAQASQQQLTQQQENYNRGIEDNRAFADSLSDALSQDDSVSKLHKAFLFDAIDTMKFNLGRTPVDNLQAIGNRLVEKGVPEQAIGQYFMPYVDRVIEQQKAKEDLDRTAEASILDDDMDPPVASRGVVPASQAIPDESEGSPNIIGLLNGREEKPKLSGKTEVANFLQERALKKLGGSPRDLADENDRDAIADDMVAEAIYEMDNSESAIEWYDSVISQMIEMMSLKHPELKTDPDSKTALLVSIAITSQNLAVPENLKYGEEVYSHFKNTGRFLEKKYGSKGGAVKNNLVKANKLLDKLGSVDSLRQFLETKFTVRELDPILKQHLDKDSKQINGENMDTEVYGAQVFGPKIGNGFYTNLRGDFSPVTIDMWFMRTVGRLQGKVLAFDQQKFDKQLSRLKTALGRKRMSQDALVKKAQELKSQHEKDYKSNRKEYDSGKRKKSEAVKAAEQVVLSLKGTRDVPASGTEREQLRDIVTKAVAKFKQQTGIDIPPASFQALIWYPEQDLYKELGVKLKSTREDYASSTKRLLIQEGYNEADLSTAANRVRQRREQGPRPVRQRTGILERGTNGPTSRGLSASVQIEDSVASATPTSGVLQQPQQLSFDYKTPTVAQIKDRLDDAKDAVEFAIGKKGTKYEKGLSTYDDYMRLADILDIAVSVYPTIGAMQQDFPGISNTAQGVYGGLQGGIAGRIGILDTTLPYNGDGDFLKTLAHEIGHGLESRPETNQPSKGRYAPSQHTGTKEQVFVRENSLRHLTNKVLQAARPMFLRNKDNERIEGLKRLSNMTYGQARTIKEEVDRLQDGTMVNFEGRPLGQRPIRYNEEQSVRRYLRLNPNASTAQALAAVGKDFPEYKSYTKETAEFIVDPLHFYLMNPTAAKKQLPVTTKFIRDHFNKSNIPIEFHSNPLVAIVAILMAGAMQAVGEGEEQEEQPASGILTPQPGVLSSVAA